MNNPTITVWSKPSCVQCNAVYRRLDAAGVEYQVFDLTEEKHEKDLNFFKGLGYSSAPITEYKNKAVPGYSPDEIDEIIEQWKKDQSAHAGRD